MGRVIAARAPHIDFVFSGAALKSFPELVADCLDGSPGGRPITGVFSKTAAAPSASCAVLGEEMSIDEPIPLDYDQFIDSYQTHFPQARVKPVAPIETSRGCWWGEKAHCTFCGLNGATMAYRAMRPDLAIQQFNAAFRYQGRVSVIEAVDNILPTSYLEQVLPFVETPDTMELWYEVKADLSRRDMATLAKARVRKIQPGIESLATSTLKLMKKGTSACQNILFLKNCADFDIRPFWNLLIGFPGEGADVYRRYVEVLPLLVHLTPPTGVHTVRFDRFGPYHKDQRGYGLQLHPMDFYRWVYPFDDTDLIDFAYYFVDQNTKAEYVQAAAEWIRKLRALVDRWQERWSGVAGAQRPRLVFKPGSDIVCDSRDGSETEREIGALGRTLLDGAMSPTRVDVLVRDCAADPAEAHQTVALLEELGLLFREGDRVISLVMTGAEAHIAERPRAFAGAERPRSKLLPMLAS
jgi:magnesium-protoporphyrin IX monomethyl ester (oxidative) cyclase